MQSIIRAKKELQNGWSIVIFPEGGIPANAPILNPFKNGAFKLAIETGTPILPITIIDNWRLFNSDPLLTGQASPGISRLIVHKPIITAGMDKKDLIHLRKQTFDTINAPLLKYVNVKK